MSLSVEKSFFKKFNGFTLDLLELDFDNYFGKKIHIELSLDGFVGVKNCGFELFNYLNKLLPLFSFDTNFVICTAHFNECDVVFNVETYFNESGTFWSLNGFGWNTKGDSYEC